MDKETQNKVEEECVEKIKSTHEDFSNLRKTRIFSHNLFYFSRPLRSGLEQKEEVETRGRRRDGEGRRGEGRGGERERVELR